jgi:hypothetical protein
LTPQAAPASSIIQGSSRPALVVPPPTNSTAVAEGSDEDQDEEMPAIDLGSDSESEDE